MELIVTTPEQIREIFRAEIAGYFESKPQPDTGKLIKPIITDRLVTQKELSDHLGYSVQTIIRWKNLDKIPFIGVGRGVRYHMPSVLKALGK